MGKGKDYIMLFADERKAITQWAFQAIKAAFGIQEKLKMTKYTLVEFDNDLSVKYGWFYFQAKSGNKYEMKIDNGEITTLSNVK